MSPLEEYLIELGYKRFRNGKEVVGNDYSFSTMEKGGCTYEYMKDGFDTIIWGLSEWHKPPTLCSQRPFIFDDDVNRFLKDKTPKEIYEAIHCISGNS